VEVERERIRPLHPCEKVPGPGSYRRPCTERPVDVEPAPLMGGNIRKCMHVVDSAGVRRPGNTDDADRVAPALPVAADRLFQGCSIDPERSVDRNPSQRFAPEPKEFDRLVNRGMRLLRAIEGHPGCLVRHSLPPHVISRHRVPRYREADKVRCGAAARKEAACGPGIAEEVLAPVEHLLFDVIVAHVGEGSADRVGCGRQHLGVHPHHGARPGDPAPVSRVGVAQLVGKDVPEVFFVHFSRGHGTCRGRPLKVRLHAAGRMLPDRAFPECLEIIHCVVNDTMAEGTHRIPVARVERLLTLHLFLRIHG